MALNRNNKFAGLRAPALAGHERGVLNPSNVGDNASYHWTRNFKNPNDLAEQIAKDNKRYEELGKYSPLDEFKNFEAANFYGAMWDNDRRFYGIKEPNQITYPQLLDAYKKSKGVHAKNITPEVQKYFNDQMAKRQSILDRFRKIPKEKSEGFQLGLGHYLDPFDFEDEYFQPEDIYNNSTLLDYDPYSWDDVGDYLTKEGY